MKWAAILAIVFALLAAFRSSVVDWVEVPTVSMTPTIPPGAHLLVNKLAYDLKLPFTTRHLWTWSNPRRGEVVIFFSPSNGARLIKRIVGLPGDVIEVREGQLYVNGRPAIPALPTAGSFSPVTVQADHYFMMGDNRDHSFDSRYFGAVSRDRIEGRASQS